MVHPGTLKYDMQRWNQSTTYNIRVNITTLTLNFNIEKFDVVITMRLCVLHGSRNKQQHLPYTTLTVWFL
jgi:hypothetical protein